MEPRRASGCDARLSASQAAIGCHPPARAMTGRGETGQLMIVNCTWFGGKESKCWSAEDSGVIMASINDGRWRCGGIE